jgi:hypothetical protein
MQDRSTFQLVMARGPRPGQIFELPRSTVSIGRDPGNRVVINDVQISRQHARVTPQGGLMVLEDLGSTNGTTVNGLRISAPHTLAHGDEVGMGDDVTLIFYGWPAGDMSETMAAAHAVHTAPPPTAPSSAYQPPVTPVYDGGTQIADQSPAASDQAAYPEYYQPDYQQQEYQEVGRNWALVGLGCVLVAIIMGLVVALVVYFFAPASIVDPIADFMAGLGINVP